ncbi:uncharacterized protein LOC123691261 [Colias croceus]|uniref:uncharacterized protein LOC123691261 n=1 Tax=Colias crocea TaxID=72248 RepID=UPI001E27B4F6|nr:uncharacterized protein LOC123691261 [Colias croceus]
MTYMMLLVIFNLILLISNTFAFGLENHFESLTTSVDKQDKSGNEISGIQSRRGSCNDVVLEPQAFNYYFEKMFPLSTLIRQEPAEKEENYQNNFQVFKDAVPEGYYLNDNQISRNGYYIIDPYAFHPISPPNSIQFDQIIPQDNTILNEEANKPRYTRSIPDNSKKDIWDQLLHDSMLNNILPTMPIPYVHKSSPYLDNAYGPYRPTYGADSNRNGCGVPIYLSCTPRITYDASVMDPPSCMYPSYTKEHEAQDSPKQNINSKVPPKN